MSRLRDIAVVLFLGSVLPAVAQAAEAVQATAPPVASPPVQATAVPGAAQRLADILAANRHPLSLVDGTLRGEGAELLAARARTAQFVLVGEDHGFADVPRFVMALDRTLGADRFPHLVIETGPHAARLLADRDQPAKVDATLRRYPGMVPFFGWRDDLAMARQWTADARVAAPLWGVDQEFLLSLQPSLERLVALAPNDRARRVANRYLAQARLADATMVTAHEPGALLLPKLDAEDFAALRVDAAPEAVTLIDSLAESAEIYRLQQTDGNRSNALRASLMKRQFMAQYRAAQAAGDPTPRAIFRMGAYHMYRGLTPTRQFDIGNFASEFAASNGRTSLHVLVIAVGGTQNRKLPFLPDEALRAAPYDGRKEFDALGGAPLIAATLDDTARTGGWTLIHLAPLRDERAARTAAGPAFEQLVFAYDLVLVIPRATAAQDL